MVDYVLSVWKAGDDPPEGAPLRLWTAQDGQQMATHPFGFDTTDFLHDGAPVNPELALTPAGLMNTRLKVSIGEALWDRLTPGEIGPALRGLVGGERIYLDLRSDELLKYPWELLRCANQFVMTAANTRWSLGLPRGTDHEFRGTPPENDHPLRVMVVTGNRPGDTNIRADEELLIIERAAHLRNSEVLLRTLRYPSAREIESKLTEFRPHVFHFIGHGSDDPNEQPQIFVYSETDGKGDPWDADRVRNIIGQAPPRVVVLNACLTAHAPTAATSLVQAFTDAGCIAAVAMTGKILGPASEAFSERFYSELFAGVPVDTATARARMAVAAIAGAGANANILEVRSNWALPRLTVRGDAQTAVVMKHSARPTSQRLRPDFVARWDQRWQAWTAFDGSRQGMDGRASHLAVLRGPKDSGTSELLNTLAATHARAGERVIYVDFSGGKTGDWPDVLKGIALQAAADGYDAAALRAIAESSASSSTEVIAQFVAGLEGLRKPGDDGTGLLLIALDGLSDWTMEVVNDTLLPELAKPFVNAAATSRVRMLIALEPNHCRDVWGERPRGWEPIRVDRFEQDEWNRALTLFREYWYTKIPTDQQTNFIGIANAVMEVPTAFSLGSLRGFARLMSNGGRDE